MVRKVQEMHHLASRNMHAWWEDYTKKMTSYRGIFDQYACPDPKKLEAELAIIDAQIKKVRKMLSAMTSLLLQNL